MKKKAVLSNPGKDSKATHPVPWKIVIQLFILTAIDAVAVGLPAPFLPAMCRDFFGDDDELISMGVGLLVGSFLLANFFSSFAIGHLSDRFGRKPLLLIGLFVISVTSVLFALSPYFWVAVMLRGIGGFFDSITSVTRACISDVTHPTARGPVFTWLGASFALSRVVSSGLGGLLAGVRIFGNDYLLACAVGGGMSFIMFFTTIFFVPETLPSKQAQAVNRHNDSEALIRTSFDGDAATRTVPATNSVPLTTVSVSIGVGTSESPAPRTPDSAAVELSSVVDGASGAGAGAGSRAEGADGADSTSHEKKTEAPPSSIPLKEGFKMMFTNTVIVRLFALYSLTSFANGGILTAISIFSTLSRGKGGLGLGPRGTGIGYVIFGLGAFLAQSLVFRKFSAEQPPRTVFLLGASLLVVSSALLPFSAWLLSMVWVWIWYSVAVVVLACGFMTALPIVNAMMANASDPRINGLTQGTASSIAALLRGAAPPLGGVLFAASIARQAPWVLFMFFSATYVVCLAIAVSMPKEGETEEEEPASA